MQAELRDAAQRTLRILFENPENQRITALTM